MTPEERLPVAWSAFKALAIKVKGRVDAARFLRECADQLDAEARKAAEIEAREQGRMPNVVMLHPIAEPAT